MKNLSLASVLSSASAQSWTRGRAEAAKTRMPLIPYLRQRSHHDKPAKHKHARKTYTACPSLLPSVGCGWKCRWPTQTGILMCARNAQHLSHTDAQRCARNNGTHVFGCLQIVARSSKYCDPLAPIHGNLQFKRLRHGSRQARSTKHMPTNNLMNLGGMLPINLYYFDLLGSAEIQLHIDPGYGIWR